MNLNDRLAMAVVKATVVLALGAAVGCNEISTGGPMFSGDDWIPDTGQITEEVRPVGSVTGVILDGVGTVFVHQGGFSELRVRAPEHVHAYLRTEMQGGTLVIGFQPGTSIQNAAPIEYHLTVVDLNRAEMIGVGAIHGSNITTGELTVIKSGVGEIDFQGLTVDRINVTQSGVGLVRLAGHANRQFASVEGMGDYEAVGLASLETDLILHAGASARVQVANRLDAAIHGSGSVYYYGNPVVTRTGNGSGTVVAL